MFSRISVLKDESDLQTCSEIISAAYFSMPIFADRVVYREKGTSIK